MPSFLFIMKKTFETQRNQITCQTSQLERCKTEKKLKTSLIYSFNTQIFIKRIPCAMYCCRHYVLIQIFLKWM